MTWKNIKQAILYLLLPFGLLLAIIQYLLIRNRRLKGEIAQKDASQVIASILAQKAEAEKDSKEKAAEFKERLDDYENYIKNNPTDDGNK